MSRRTILFFIATIAIVCTGGSARAADSAKTDAAPAATAPPDLNGDWRFDADHSEMPQAPPGGSSHGGGSWGGGGGGGMSGGGWGGGGGGHHGGWGGGGGGGHHGGGDASAHGGEGGKPRMARLPDLLHITQTATIVSFEDSAGAVVREVATVPAAADTFARAPNAEHIAGQWESGKLVIHRTGPHDAKITETISLTNKGRMLVIDDQIEANGDMPAREFKRVYTRSTTES